MKIVFTAKGEHWESPMDARFGRMESLVIYNEESDTLEVVSNDDVEVMEHGAGLQTAKKVMELKPDVIITGNGAGQKALDLLKRTNVKVYIGAGDMSIKEAYEAYKNNRLALQF